MASAPAQVVTGRGEVGDDGDDGDDGDEGPLGLVPPGGVVLDGGPGGDDGGGGLEGPFDGCFLAGGFLAEDGGRVVVVVGSGEDLTDRSKLAERPPADAVTVKAPGVAPAVTLTWASPSDVVALEVELSEPVAPETPLVTDQAIPSPGRAMPSQVALTTRGSA